MTEFISANGSSRPSRTHRKRIPGVEREKVFMPIPETWSRTAQRVGVASSISLLVVGVSYVAVIGAWLVRERTPSEPIGDPYLAVMEVLTIASALALLGFCSAVASYCDLERRSLALMALGCGTLAAGITMCVHFVQLTAIRQLWESGELNDYRLVWPSMLFSVEYLAWDVLVGLTMLMVAGSLGRESARGARTVLATGGVCCLAGVSGPATGQMMLQNIAVFGYAILLPLAAYLMARLFRTASPTSGSAV